MTQNARTWERIWAVVRGIPPGRVATYGQVAALAGFASQPRLAGYALHALPDGSAVPWHRVINARGRISLPARTGQYALQRSMLEAEGITFAGERIDLRRHGWNGKAPSAARHGSREAGAHRRSRATTDRSRQSTRRVRAPGRARTPRVAR